MTGAKQSQFEQMWKMYQNLVFKYGTLEKKKAVKDLLLSFAGKEDAGTDVILVSCSLQIAYKMYILIIGLVKGECIKVVLTKI